MRREATPHPGLARLGAKIFVAELLRDGLEFPNAILQEGFRYIEDGLCQFSGWFMTIYYFQVQKHAPLCGPPSYQLLPNSSETAWNFETPFYRKDLGTSRMVFNYFL